MPKLTEQQIQKALDRGVSPGQIKRYAVTGNTESKTAFQRIGGFLSKVGGLALGVLETPQAITTAIGRSIGTGTIEGGRAGAEQLREEVGAIPGQVAERAKGGILSEPLPEPASELGLTGIPAIAFNVWSDPLTAYGLITGGAQQIDDVVRAAKQLKGGFQEFGERFFQNVLNPRNADEAREFSKLGKVFEDAIKDNVDTLGSRFAKLKIKGKFKTMIGQVNERMKTTGKILDDALRTADDVIDTSPILDDLAKAADNLRRIGKDDAAKAILKGVENLGRETGTRFIHVKDAVELRRLFDTGRKLLSGTLSEADEVAVIISNGLRKQINKTSIGAINEVFDTLYDAQVLLSKEAAKMSKKLPGIQGLLPPKISGIDVSGAKTVVGAGLIKLGKTLNVPVKTLKAALKQLGPQVLRNILRELQD